MVKQITYDYNKWKHKINKLNVYDDIKEHIIGLSKFSKSPYHYMKIKNDNITKSFLNIDAYRYIYLAFDIEFQRMTTNNNKYELNVNQMFAIFPRELGLMMFIRDNENFMHYVGNIFVNFQSLAMKGFDILNMGYTQSIYSTVTKYTNNEMTDNDNYFKLDYMFKKLYADNLNDKLINDLINKIENKDLLDILPSKDKNKIFVKINDLKNLNNNTTILQKIEDIKNILKQIPFNISGKHLNKYDRSKFMDQHMLYNSDPLVKKRLLTSTNEVSFMNFLHETSKSSCLIAKGNLDIVALNNMNNLLDIENSFKTMTMYDIEVFNNFSRTHFGSAKLEATYENIIEYKIYEDNFNEFVKIKDTIKGSAHNPLVDSYYTIVVALVINMILNSYIYSTMNGGHIFNSNWYYNYIKIKKDYHDLKNLFF